jgi:hypothetical protein
MSTKKQDNAVKLNNAFYKQESISGNFLMVSPRLRAYSHNGMKAKDGEKFCIILKDNQIVSVRVTPQTQYQFFNTEEESLLNSNINDLGEFSFKEIKQEIDAMEDIKQPLIEETEEQAANRIRKRFKVMESLVEAVASGVIRALVVSGPAGVGKTHGIETQLKLQRLENENMKYEFIKGTATAFFIYQKLFEFKDRNSILVFDDCDSVFYDQNTLNLFKAVLDTTEKRTVTWGSDSRTLERKDIPNSFDFEGQIVFITNLKFDQIKSGALKEHLQAIESRCHYLSLDINSNRDKFIRIKQVILESEMLYSYRFSKEKQQQIINYVEKSLDTLRELSLRTVKKIADLAKFSDDWETLADVTCNKK